MRLGFFVECVTSVSFTFDRHATASTRGEKNTRKCANGGERGQFDMFTHNVANSPKWLQVDNY